MLNAIPALRIGVGKHKYNGIMSRVVIGDSGLRAEIQISVYNADAGDGQLRGF